MQLTQEVVLLHYPGHYPRSISDGQPTFSRLRFERRGIDESPAQRIKLITRRSQARISL